MIDPRRWFGYGDETPSKLREGLISSLYTPLWHRFVSVPDELKTAIILALKDSRHETLSATVKPGSGAGAGCSLVFYVNLQPRVEASFPSSFIRELDNVLKAEGLTMRGGGGRSTSSPR
eukprot:CAMPEP_0184653254 /NCGR_PEP_ID=MMETSP0308-20130426/10983_1 /TAXON_ID=38269 /ORGANISM="Gloeochaete witrockiana, Strain SAG 46.84" /LENGTH=118 /DNA_ID=CAMNT_0027088621 /DNA_START=816 /DNA_END=1172 /DNA_ORIENTATION=-